MRNIIYIAVALLIGATACQVVETPEPAADRIIISISADPVYEEGWEPETKAVIHGTKMYWTPGDTLGVFPGRGSQVYFLVDSEGEAVSAPFDGGDWEFKANAVYRSYYPFFGDIYLNPAKIPIQFYKERNGRIELQTQEENDSSIHTSEYLYMYTDPQEVINGSISFAYHHLWTVLKPMVDLPEGHYTKLTFSLDEPLFVEKGYFDLTSDAPAIVGTEYDNEASLDLDITFDTSSTLTAYYATAPLDMQGKTLTITITEGSGREYTYTYNPSKAYKAGTTYKLASATSFAIEGVLIDETNLALNVDQTHTLIATVLPANAANKSVTWSSSNPSVATVDDNGKVTAISPGTTVITVATVEGNKSATCNVTVSESDDLSTPLCLEAVEAGTVTVSNPLAKTIETKKNGNDWTSSSDATIEIPVAVGDRVYFRGNNASYTASDDEYTNIASTGKVYAYGNVMSLINSTSFPTLTTLTGQFTFGHLFKGNDKLYNHPERELKLPARTLMPSCYRGMFWGCSNLVSAPELPSTALAWGVYKFMFRDCTSLVNAPALPALKVHSNGYCSMFTNCTSLKDAPALPATELGDQCYQSMFEGCTSLENAPELPATTLAVSCYYSMFYGCSSLVNAPALPATTLAKQCYYQMFRDCINLTNAPALLPATQLTELCYAGMFRNNRKLVDAPALPATELAPSCYLLMFFDCYELTGAPDLPAFSLAERCYEQMFTYCKKLQTAPDLLAETLNTQCYKGMFFGCSLLNYIKMLATDISATDAMTDWTKSVAATGTFVKNFDATWDVVGVNGIPEGWVVEKVFVRDQIHVTGVTLNNSTLSLVKGETAQLIATVAPSDADIKDLIWSSLNPSVATVDQEGKVSAIAGGSAVIKVESVDGNKQAICTVTVNVPVTSVTLNKTSISLSAIGANETLVATVKPDDATNGSVTWTSSNTSVATVDSNGKVTAVASGSATITASAGGISATCNVSVTVAVTGVSLNKTTLTLVVGSSDTLTATIAPTGATNKNVTWTTSNSSVATVTDGTVLAKAAGTAVITVKTEDGNKTATCSVTVNPVSGSREGYGQANENAWED